MAGTSCSPGSDAATLALPAHRAVVVDDDQALLEEVLPFVRAARDEGSRVVVNLRADWIALLADQLGAEADAVSWTDTHAWEPHPARRLRALDQMLAGRRGPKLRFVGECAFGDAPAPVVREWLAFDALLNEPLSRGGAEMLCVYDPRVLAAPLLDRALAAHPYLGGGPQRPNPAYRGTVDAFASDGLLEVPSEAHRARVRPSAADARGFVAEAARAMHLDVPEDELKLVVSELVANAARSGAETVTVALWEADGLVCLQVDDDGPGLSDPLLGYRLPPLDAPGGRGLAIVRYLAEATEIRSSAAGTSVRVHLAGRTR